MAKQNIWIIVLTAVITAVVVGGGMYWWQSFSTPVPVNEQIVKFNCEQSGGVWSDSNCDCSGVDSEFGEYEESTGYCITADGSPGGELGETARKLLELEMTKGEQAKPLVFFMREKIDGQEYWVLYQMKGTEKVKTGLSVAHQENPSAMGEGENFYAALSPDGKQVAYLQKPAWPHVIYVANIDGSNARELVTPVHPSSIFIENSFVWSPDGKSLYFSETASDGGMFEGTEAAVLYKVNVETGEREEIIRDVLEWKNQAEFMPIKIVPIGF